MHLSKEMALILHRMMWSDMQKELGDNPSGDVRNRFKSEWIQRMFPEEYIANHCFLCEYAGNDGCSKCPIEWGNVQVSKWCAKCIGDNTSYLSTPISEILALPEKGKEEIKAEAAAIASYNAEYYYALLKHRQTLSYSSGLPVWVSDNKHIDAIRKKSSDCRAKTELEGIKKWLSAFSELPESEELHKHVSAIIDKNYDRGYDRGMKDLLEAMKEKVEG